MTPNAISHAPGKCQLLSQLQIILNYIHQRKHVVFHQRHANSFLQRINATKRKTIKIIFRCRIG